MSHRVLVIDDDPAIREVVRLSLSLVGGFEVDEAGSGREGAATARATVPDAVLLDVMMPGTDGPATLELLRGQDSTRHVPVVFLTAKLMREERDRLEGMGAAGVLAKPFDPIALPGLLAGLLGWS